MPAAPVGSGPSWAACRGCGSSSRPGYLAPLLLIALLAWADGQIPKRWLVAGAAALAAGLLPVVIPYTSYVNLGALSDTFVFIALWRLVFTGFLALGTVKLFVTVCALA